jgi:YbgC/YbaW family acyl-CoA thioester hydrolase
MEKIPYSNYTIRFSDCDLFGHLNNARYLDYFLNAREDHLKAHYQMDLTDFYRKGTSWLVGSHEINYLRPALYNEVVTISSSLIKATENYLLVELQMMNLEQSELKAVMWTKFIPVNVKTGRRADHDPAFMTFAKSIEQENSFVEGGLKTRLIGLIREKKLIQS